jgi:hypothetical protein
MSYRKRMEVIDSDERMNDKANVEKRWAWEWEWEWECGSGWCDGGGEADAAREREGLQKGKGKRKRRHNGEEPRSGSVGGSGGTLGKLR